ncbi:SDR family oxidoreductase [Mycolicibacterium sp. 018/SC-01/001]|uniref:SDR family NAD(P)-dependent oxidoreductase n=1 Tax=Mycolicibacterium sp. 018/SC-01/001 TaxID=2592069 RepID=UPI00117DDBF5|nr:SDR family oxidoreductase [Mycolicibacterium sp. 018/SC-01/001]TRW81177.1 SDR family oxidoreductase [Mycolicibacterium sp. 018/SC-01/001]
MNGAELKGRTAVVTGGTSGIGLATARLLTHTGAHVIVSDDNLERGKLAAAQLGSGTRFLPASLADLGDVDFLARQAPIDILITAAAITDQRILQGIYFLVSAVAQPMIRRGGGAMVNLLPSVPEFRASLRSLTRTWAAEFGPHGIRVNCVAPCPPGTDNALGRTAEASEVAEAMAFLASPRASSITGATLSVDGGATVSRGHAESRR